MTSDAAIEVASLTKTYRDGFFGRRRVEALRGVSFRVERGEIFGLLGPNGAGKTTVIKILLGIVRKSGGSAGLLGRPAGERIGRRNVGYLPENHRIPRHLTAHSALDYYGSLSDLRTHEIRRRRDQLLELVGLSQWGPTSVKKFSKGMLQRLGLAQAMLHEPDLLILDEPTDGVDPVGRSEMRTILQQLKNAGKTVFLNSHLLQEVELVCDRVAILDRGQLRCVGAIDEITRRSEAETQLQVSGTESVIRAALGTRKVTEWTATPPDQFHVTVRLDDQVEIDLCVDDLRRSGVSIVGLSQRRDTLEQAFLGILRRAPVSLEVAQKP